MFSRSIVGSFRLAARPAVVARPSVARAVARGYSEAAKEEKKEEQQEGQSDDAKKIAELEEQLKDAAVSGTMCQG